MTDIVVANIVSGHSCISDYYQQKVNFRKFEEHPTDPQLGILRSCPFVFNETVVLEVPIEFCRYYATEPDNWFGLQMFERSHAFIHASTIRHRLPPIPIPVPNQIHLDDDAVLPVIEITQEGINVRTESPVEKATLIEFVDPISGHMLEHLRKNRHHIFPFLRKEPFKKTDTPKPFSYKRIGGIHFITQLYSYPVYLSDFIPKRLAEMRAADDLPDFVKEILSEPEHKNFKETVTYIINKMVK